MRYSRIESKGSRLSWGLAVIIVLLATLPAQANADDNAGALYLQANALIKVECPSASSGTFPSVPPYSAEWQEMEQSAFDANQPAFDLARSARDVDHANWPNEKAIYLSDLRNLANQLGDAAAYLDLHQRDAEAVEKIKDILHMADLIGAGNKQAVRNLVATGIRAIAMYRLMIISSNGHLTNAAANKDDLQVRTARLLIQQLLDEPRAQEQANGLKKSFDWPAEPGRSRLMEVLNRISSECDMTAMSLACHLFQFDKQRWPDSLADLIPNYLPHLTMDPWGDGKEPIGYILIVGGLPDGSDRPLVYCRCNSTNGLFYRTDSPWYEYYYGDGSKLKRAAQKHGGEFRDVTRWEPSAGGVGGPTTRPLP